MQDWLERFGKHTCSAVRETKGMAAAWSKETSSGIVASKLGLMQACSAYVPAFGTHLLACIEVAKALVIELEKLNCCLPHLDVWLQSGESAKTLSPALNCSQQANYLQQAALSGLDKLTLAYLTVLVGGLDHAGEVTTEDLQNRSGQTDVIKKRGVMWRANKLRTGGPFASWKRATCPV